MHSSGALLSSPLFFIRSLLRVLIALSPQLYEIPRAASLRRSLNRFKHDVDPPADSGANI